MVKKAKQPKLTKYELTILIRHTLEDLSYGAGGTYLKKGTDDVFDEREAAAARRAVEKLREMLGPRAARTTPPGGGATGGK